MELTSAEVVAHLEATPVPLEAAIRSPDEGGVVSGGVLYVTTLLFPDRWPRESMAWSENEWVSPGGSERVKVVCGCGGLTRMQPEPFR